MNTLSRFFKKLLVTASLCLFLSGFSVTASALTCKEVPVVINNFLANHVGQRQFTDELSSRMLDTYLKILDPQKIYFLQPEVDRFKSQYEFVFDDMHYSDRGDFCKAFGLISEVFKRNYKRSVGYIDGLHAGLFDFSHDDYIETDVKKIIYPATPEEQEERLIKMVKYQLLDQLADGDSIAESLVRTKKGMGYQKKHLLEDLSNKDIVLSYILNAFAISLDPHSQYLRYEDYESFMDDINLQLTGIGARLSWEHGYTKIIELIKGGPASKSDLKADDLIIAVSQGDDRFVNTVGMRINDVVKLIKGTKGTPVILKVQSQVDGVKSTRNIRIIRDKIDLVDDRASIELRQVPGSSKGTVAVITFKKFYNGLTDDVEEQWNSLKTKSDIESVIVDLRGNGGGLLDEAIDLSALFLGDRPVVLVRNFHSWPQTVSQGRSMNRTHPLIDKPLVVLVSTTSASASEIFAAAMQDYKRGIIVGDEKTWGKGTVQAPVLVNVQNEELGATKMTIAKYYRVTGEATQSKGVSSDLAFPSMSELNLIGEDKNDYAFKEDSLDQWWAVDVEKRAAGIINKETVDNLKKLSVARTKSDKFFNIIKMKLDEVNNRQVSQSSVNLNLDTYLQNKKQLEVLDPKKNDFVLSEAIAVARDLATYELQMVQNLSKYGRF